MGDCRKCLEPATDANSKLHRLLKLSPGLLIGLRLGSSRRSMLLPIIALTLSIAVLISTLAVMRGFEDALRNRLLGLFPHLVLASDQPLDWPQWRRQLLAEPEILGVAPNATLIGLLQGRQGSAPILLNGIDPRFESEVSTLADHLGSGSLQQLTKNDLIAGNSLAEQIGVAQGQTVRLTVPTVVDGRFRPRQLQMRLAAIYDSGTEIDWQLALMHILKAQELLASQGDTTSLKVKLADPMRAAAVRQRLQGKYPELKIISWTDTHGSLHHSLKLSRQLVVLLLLMVVIVAAFNVVAMLLVTTGERRLEIAMLRSIGANPATITAAILVFSQKIALAGTLAGVIVGIAIASNVSGMVNLIEQLLGRPLLNDKIYYLSYVPVKISMPDILFTVAMATAICFLSALYPAWRAGSLSPSEVLRWDG